MPMRLAFPKGRRRPAPMHDPAFCGSVRIPSFKFLTAVAAGPIPDQDQADQHHGKYFRYGLSKHDKQMAKLIIFK
jgi:hypothetical protein